MKSIHCQSPVRSLDLSIRDAVEAPQAKHTPGPWFLEAPGFNSVSGVYYVAGPNMKANGGTLTSVCQGPDGEANARLIASAPFMLSVIGESVEMLSGNPSRECVETVIAMLNSAIAKATGGAA